MLTREIIGARIKEYREEKKISQQLMVEKLKELELIISRETLSKIESGNRTISAMELKVICSVLDLTVEGVLEEQEEDNLITLFRKRNANSDTLRNVETLQDMIMSFMNQKKISKVEGTVKVEPLWR